MPQEALSASQLSRLPIGHARTDALCAKFSNVVEPAARIDALESAIANDLKFKRAPDKESLSCHLIDRDLNSGIALRLVKGAGKSSYKVDKIKSSTVKLCFLSVTHPADAIDFRLKLIGQVALSSDTKQWSKVVSEELLSAVGGRGGGVEKARGARLQSGRVVIDSIRRKTKKVFDGVYRGDAMRLSITRVEDENGEHCEVAASSAALGGSGIVERKNVERAVSFCSDLCGLLARS